jgi:pyrimidine-specific ribonucleoside hydrolase
MNVYLEVSMRSGKALVLAALLFWIIPGCGDSEPAADTTGKTLVMVDSDGAFDDIKAILYLLEQPDVEILALTMSGTGIAHCPAAAENTAALLERIGAPDIPVACGRTEPLEGDNQAPEMWRNSADTLGGVELPEPRSFSADGAADLLRKTIEDADRNITLVALGPLTNVAEAIEEEPDLLDKVDMIYLMGGAVDVGGNVFMFYGNETAEFNIWADPTAAEMVFATEVPITLVPLDATNELPVTPYLYEAVAAHRDASAVADFVADYLDVTPLLGGMYHWDELAAVAATDESVVTVEDRNLAVITSPGDREGATVDDPAGRPVRVAVTADRAVFESLFYDAIIGTADPGVPAWEPDAVLSWDGTTCTYEGPDPLPDEFFVRLDNDGDGTLVFLTGAYDAGTTRADFEAALAAGEPGEPDWWLPGGQTFTPAGARDVWPMRGGEGLTALCYAGPTQVWEVAGPRLPD